MNRKMQIILCVISVFALAAALFVAITTRAVDDYLLAAVVAAITAFFVYSTVRNKTKK